MTGAGGQANMTKQDTPTANPIGSPDMLGAQPKVR